MERLVCLEDYEEKALSLLGQNERDYLYSGADEEITMQWNKDAFKRISIRPRVLRNVLSRDLHTTLLGSHINTPIGISPTGYQGLYHPDGETATVKGATNVGTCYIMSSVATRSIEEIRETSPSSLKWFQVYVSKNRNRTASNIKRAAKAGFKALVLTADLPIPGKRRCNIRKPMILPPHITTPLFAINYTQGGLPGSGDTSDEVTWDLISWMKELTGLPVVVKGILTAEDAELAILHGADAIFVSNHGGRQLDTVPASIEVLPEIVKAVNGRVEVYLDGGVRTGTDVLKALALGARAVFVGRPIVWGLTCNGNEGVKNVLQLLTEELSTAMALAGCRRLDDIKTHMVVRSVDYSRL